MSRLPGSPAHRNPPHHTIPYPTPPHHILPHAAGDAVAPAALVRGVLPAIASVGRKHPCLFGCAVTTLKTVGVTGMGVTGMGVMGVMGASHVCRLRVVSRCVRVVIVESMWWWCVYVVVVRNDDSYHSSGGKGWLRVQAAAKGSTSPPTSRHTSYTASYLRYRAIPPTPHHISSPSLSPPPSHPHPHPHRRPQRIFSLKRLFRRSLRLTLNELGFSQRLACCTWEVSKLQLGNPDLTLT